MDIPIILFGFLSALVSMEFIAWATHRWIMHGPLWFLHRSHHSEGKKRFEANDLFGVFFSCPAIGLIWLGKNGSPFSLGLGLGMTAYGLAYLIMHDILTHRRFGKVRLPRNAYLLHLVRVHRLHHSRDALDGTRHFGFLWAPKVELLFRSSPEAD